MTAIVSGQPASESFRAIGTTATVVVTGRAALHPAVELLRADLAALDGACSRFRADSEIRAVERAAGRWVEVSPLLARCLDAALRVASLTAGLVDPTVATCMDAIGYDRDFDLLGAAGPTSTRAVPRPAPGWWRIGWEPARRRVLVPRGVRIDLGSTAKALAADLVVHRIAEVTRCGVLVNLGGDLAVAGPPPPGGWRVHVTDDHALPGAAGQVVTLGTGGLATSGTTRRRWQRLGTAAHHIVDPRTGRPAGGPWRTVSVAAGNCLDANAASTAAIVLGAAAHSWLTAHRLPARLVAQDGQVALTDGWPGELG